MTLRPSHLPKTRDQVLHHLDTPASALRGNLGPRHQPGLDGLAGHLRAAGLYWIAPDMAALSVSSGARLAAARWAAADRPSQGADGPACATPRLDLAPGRAASWGHVRRARTQTAPESHRPGGLVFPSQVRHTARTARDHPPAWAACEPQP